MQFPDIILSKRDIGRKAYRAADFELNYFNQSICRNDTAIRSGQFFVGKQAEGYGSIAADAEKLISLNDFFKADLHLLSFVIKRRRHIGDLDILSGINKLNGLLTGKQHSVRALHFDNSVFAEIQGLTLRFTRCRSDNGVNDVALFGSNRAIRSNDVLHRNNVEFSTGKTRHRINRKISFSVCLNAAEHLTGLFDIDDALLRCVREVDHNQRDSLIVHSVVIVNLKFNRLAVKHIPVRRLYFLQTVITLVELLRRNEITVSRGVECVYLRQRWIGVLHYDAVAVSVIEMERSSGIRDLSARFTVHLNKFQIGSKRSVVDQILINLAVCVDIHRKGRHIFGIFPTFDLANGIFAIRQILAFRKSVLIANEDIPFAFKSILITSGGCQKYLKLSAFLRSFDLCFACVGVFDDCDRAFDDIFIHAAYSGIVLDRIQSRFCADMMAYLIYQIPLRRAELFQLPIVAADIIGGNKIAVAIRREDIDQFSAFINAVFRTGE